MPLSMLYFLPNVFIFGYRISRVGALFEPLTQCNSQCDVPNVYSIDRNGLKTSYWKRKKQFVWLGLWPKILLYKYVSLGCTTIYSICFVAIDLWHPIQPLKFIYMHVYILCSMISLKVKYAFLLKLWHFYFSTISPFNDTLLQ